MLMPLILAVVAALVIAVALLCWCCWDIAGLTTDRVGGGVECSLNSKCSRIQLNVCIHFLLYNDKYINLGNENGVEKTFNETELKPKAESNENISFYFIYIFNAIMSWCWALLLYLFMCIYFVFTSELHCKIPESRTFSQFHNSNFALFYITVYIICTPAYVFLFVSVIIYALCSMFILMFMVSIAIAIVIWLFYAFPVLHFSYRENFVIRIVRFSCNSFSWWSDLYSYIV